MNKTVLSLMLASAIALPSMVMAKPIPWIIATFLKKDTPIFIAIVEKNSSGNI